MIWKWITLLCVLKQVGTFESPIEPGQQTKPNSFSINSNKISNKHRLKNSRITNQSIPPAVDSENTNDVIESYFPDVIYPTSILEAAQPFYYSQYGYDDVLSPFSNDVKSSYKTIVSGKDKPKSNYSPLKSQDRHSEIAGTINQENDKVSYIDDPLSLNNKITNSTLTEDTTTESCFGKTYEGEAHNFTYELNDGVILNLKENDELFNNEYQYQSQETVESLLEHHDVLNINIYLNKTDDMEKLNTDTIDGNVQSTNVQIVEKEENNKTFYISPNYIMTSDTGNNHEDFVTDIMNIYSLIEETIRAISVVEFVVSKTLGALGGEDKKSETILFDDYISNSTEGSYDELNNSINEYNVHAVDDYYVDNINKSYELI